MSRSRQRSIDTMSDSGVRGSQPTLSSSGFRMKRETHSRRAFDIGKPVRARIRHLGAARTTASRKPCHKQPYTFHRTAMLWSNLNEVWGRTSSTYGNPPVALVRVTLDRVGSVHAFHAEAETSR
jgi:hypothetical protein